MKSLLALLSTLSMSLNSLGAKNEYTFTAQCYISRCQNSSGCEVSEKNQYTLCVEGILLKLRQSQCDGSYQSQTQKSRTTASEKFLQVAEATFRSNCPVMSRASNQICPAGRFAQNLNSDLKVCGPQAFD